MARQLNPAGIGYANVKMLVCVQDDNVTVVDVANPSNAITPDQPSLQVPTSGTYGLQFPILKGPNNFSTYGYTMNAAAQIDASANATNGLTIFAAFNGINVASFSNSAYLMVESNGQTEARIGFVSGGQTPFLDVVSSQIIVSNTSLGVNTPHSVMVTYNFNKSGNIYVDGVLTGSNMSPGLNGTQRTPARIGTLTGQSNFGGWPVIIAVWNTVLDTHALAIHQSLTGNNAFTLILPTQTAFPTKLFSNGAVQSMGFTEGGTPANISPRFFSSNTVQALNMQEVAGAPFKWYSNGTFQSTQFIEI